ncbi:MULTISPECIES: GrpB family protein [unclassified Microcoleus]|uniref:GrpB family protein n=1 Tax=unclassified Microcoleus TaxID=2642155 RepID=UPI0025D5FF71|nr:MULTISPECIES: GrpB family protein [unclassified Microcoleus]
MSSIKSVSPKGLSRFSRSEEAQQYSELKQELANKYYDNIQGYMDGKAGFIKAMDMKAAKWRASD